MDTKEIRCEGVNWIELAQDRIQWRALVNTVLVPEKAGNILTT
jgi:hypothetical protein